MSSFVPPFGEWLDRALEKRAREAGEDVETYVARAVALQMLADQRHSDSGAVEELIAHLAEAGIVIALPMADVSAVINDPDRLRALHATGLLDTPPEPIYDRITRAAADALDAPHAAMSLVDVDRQFFKSTAGMKVQSDADRQTPLARSVCQYTVANGTALVVEDARIDPMFKSHPAVLDGTVVAYLGIPLIDGAGNAVGTLCVYDTKPRIWSSGHVQVLSDLAEIAADRVFGADKAPRR
ncbi:MAG: GAF domain-containing protein [Mycolicibacterium sp.]|uniref:GAF domain-containing protein n=1 Tax=Mycolicibacterium sp. TaxID=2320850 RepID=UPI003D13A6A1